MELFWNWLAQTRKILWKLGVRFMVLSSSLKFAVLVLLLLSLELAIGTTLEAQKGTAFAKYWIYESFIFRSTLAALGINIYSVALSRLPWKWAHFPFLIAHLGILLLLLGAWITDRAGIDGSLRLSEGTSSARVELDQYLLVIEGNNRLKSFEIPWTPQERFAGITLPQKGSDLAWQITHFLPSSKQEINFRKMTVPEKQSWSLGKDLMAVQLRVQGDAPGMRGDFWIWQGAPAWSSLELGPAKFEWTQNIKMHPGKIDGPRLLIEKTGDQLSFAAWRPEGVHKTQVPLEDPIGRWVETDWKGGVRIQVLEVISEAILDREYSALEGPEARDSKSPAIYLEPLASSVPAASEGFWLGLGDQRLVVDQGQSWRVAFQPRQLVLPFALKLDRFELQTDPGSAKAAAFRSSVQLLANSAGPEEAQSYMIEMNEPLKWRGYTFYQTSYETGEAGSQVSILTVNKDPGREVKYLGSIFLVLGCVFLFLRKSLAAWKRKQVSSVFGPLTASLLCLLSTANLLFAQPPHSTDVMHQKAQPSVGVSFFQLGSMAIQHQGRVKSIDAFAREMSLFLTGSRFYQGWDPVDLLMSILAFPNHWTKEPFIWIGREDAKKQLGLDISLSRFDPLTLWQNASVVAIAKVLEGRKPQNPRESEIKTLLDRLSIFRALISGEMWNVIPGQQEVWENIQNLKSKEEVQKDPLRAQLRLRFAEWILAYQSHEWSRFQRLGVAFQAEVASLLPEGEAEDLGPRLKAEVLLNRLRPLGIAGILYAVFASGALWRSWRRKNQPSKLLWSLGVTAWAFHAFGFALRCFVSGRPPVTNMYESVLWVSFGIASIGALLSLRAQAASSLLGVTGFMAALAMLLSDAAPAVMDASIQPLMPVLRSNFWLTIHVLTITLSYAAFALSAGLAHWALWRFSRSDQVGALVLNKLNDQALKVGVVLLAAGTLLGGVWADQSWGRFWGWDPKEVWALITLLVYVAILHGRYAGWVGHVGYAFWSAVCFLSVLMAWYGVNFLLGVGLHSYGFSSGGSAIAIPFVLIEAIVLGGMAWKIQSQKVVSSGL